MRNIQLPTRLEVLLLIMQLEKEMIKNPQSFEHESFLRKSIKAHERELRNLTTKNN